MKKILLLVLMLTLILGADDLSARRRWLSPRGDNANAGTDSSSTGAWRTLGKASQTLIAGDTLFVLGGSYTPGNTPVDDDSTTGGYSEKTARWQMFEASSSGTAANPIVVKAFGDSRAIFRTTGADGSSTRKYFYNHNGYDYITFDGWSFLSPSDSLYLEFEARCGWIVDGVDSCASAIRPDFQYAFNISSSSTATANNFKGIEIDGNHPPNRICFTCLGSTSGATGVRAITTGGGFRYVFSFDHTELDTISSCYIHHVYFPTGTIAPGDSSDRQQSAGEAIFFNNNVRRCYIADNTFLNSNHAILSSLTNTIRYNKIVNNKVENYWGGGIYINVMAMYNLVDGNLIMHSGESTTKTKGALAINGSQNTVRRNVIYCPNQYPTGNPWGIESQNTAGYVRKADSNYVYNNTAFGCNTQSIELISGPIRHADCSVRWNTFFNNIFYNSYGVDAENRRASEINLYLYDSPSEHDWIEPSVAGTSPATTQFGWNRFHNNIIKKRGFSNNPNLIGYTENSLAGGGRYGWSLSYLESLCPEAWFGNIEQNPLLISTEPDVYGVFNTWWGLQSGSPCIDAGTYIPDPIGVYVESLYPGYGWSATLPFNGTSIDIGAYEFSQPIQLCPLSR